ncbi:MAG: histone H1 [Pyrinomonadaceae bacterium]
MEGKYKRPPRDANQLAKYILDATTGDAEKIEPPIKDERMLELSKLGASKGGEARRDKLTPARRHEIAKRAAESRWGKKIA